MNQHDFYDTAIVNKSLEKDEDFDRSTNSNSNNSTSNSPKPDRASDTMPDADYATANAAFNGNEKVNRYSNTSPANMKNLNSLSSKYLSDKITINSQNENFQPVSSMKPSTLFKKLTNGNYDIAKSFPIKTSFFKQFQKNATYKLLNNIDEQDNIPSETHSFPKIDNVSGSSRFSNKNTRFLNGSKNELHDEFSPKNNNRRITESGDSDLYKKVINYKNLNSNNRYLNLNKNVNVDRNSLYLDDDVDENQDEIAISPGSSLITLRS